MKSSQPLNVVRWFWIPYAVVIVLMVVTLAWNARQQALIMASQDRIAAVEQKQTDALNKACAFITKLEEVTHGQRAGAAPFCSQ